MNTHLEAVSPSGPLVTVAFNLPAAFLMQLRKSFQPTPRPVEVLALIDTGADASVVDPAVLAPLLPFGLVSAQMLFVNAPALGPVAPVFEFIVSLELPVGIPKRLRLS